MVRTREEIAALQEDEAAMHERLNSVVKAINAHEEAIRYDDNRVDFLEEIEALCRANLDELRFEMGRKAACSPQNATTEDNKG